MTRDEPPTTPIGTTSRLTVTHTEAVCVVPEIAVSILWAGGGRGTLDPRRLQLLPRARSCSHSRITRNRRGFTDGVFDFAAQI